ncbi:NrfD/PsrC family molybdoenzyme membrane anchor subunit [Amycolatopsis palatopharyngis]|uniref:NrfD/PsrC family molybdoenzyme membrane anchor subunit n=1 Tax=Amycolatopsis palatopharyngis TaxID=187982 RepID=UPI000E278C8D|nr:NrfD/PsrC family molybdoenzyme membrane anchor subunit [Amycolatopsis palatopharyngis]
MSGLGEQLNHPLPDSPWGPLLAIYFVLVAVPSGLTLAAQWSRATYPGLDRGVLRRTSWIALAAACGAGLLLVVDLGRPERFFLMLTRFDNLGSPIALGGKILAVKIFLLIADLYLTRHLPRDGQGPVPADRLTRGVEGALRVALVLTSLALALYPVSVLSMTWVAPLASSSGAALIYLTTTLLIGAAGFLVLQLYAPPADSAGPLAGSRAAILALLGLYLVAGLFEWLAVAQNPVLSQQVGTYLSSGSGAVLLWGGAVGAGLVLAAPGLALPRAGRTIRLFSAASVIVGMAAVRYLIFATGP